jgi:predicted transcriptional regulator
MIITDNIIKYIPFTHLTRTQVAELLGKSPSAVDYYTQSGRKVAEDHVVHLIKEGNGQFLTTNVVDFIEKTKKAK